ncbi:hypothetical protein F4X10_24215 [Candidatus Poribacteria bacterium]|nr:hypothetical protein [Candidatus Poribacteria bacterium]
MDKIPDWLKKIFWCLLFFISLLVVSILWRYMPFDWLSYFFEIDKETQFGDRFEAINALFAGLAFAGVIFAIILQWLELGLQRQELKDTRAEIKGQKETLQKQNFESSFFQLLSMHSEIVNSMKLPREDLSGRECFGYLFQGLKNTLEIAIGQGRPKTEVFNATYEEEFFSVFQPYVGHYFRHLYNVIKFVHEHEFFDEKESKEKKRYTNLIRAQLSSDELGVLFYNCLSDRGVKFKDLVENYALFEDMPSEVFIDPEDKERYDPSAYGEMLYKWDSISSD